MFLRNFVFILALAVMAGCTSAPLRPLPTTVTIKLKGTKGQVSETRYDSVAHILSYDDHQLVRERTESVAFSVASHVLDFEPKGGLIQLKEKTIAKDGTVALHELGFPELNEEIDYVLKQNGEVLKAGHFPPKSLFFVPSFPIPPGPVRKGDTWNMEHTWYSATEAIPLHLQVIGILKDIVSCERGKVCADIEVSGDVTLGDQPNVRGAHYTSHLWGRMLFSLDRGDVIWSKVRSREDIETPGHSMKVSSCMVSEMNLYGKYLLSNSCDPDKQKVTPIPAL